MIENRNSYAHLIILMASRNYLLDEEFRNKVNFADLFYTFVNPTELDELFFGPVLEERKGKRGYKGIIQTIEKESLFFGSPEYRKLFHETSKNLVENVLKRINSV